MQDVTRGSISWKICLNQTKSEVWGQRSCHSNVFFKSLSFPLPLPVWRVAGRPCPTQSCDLFPCSTRWGRTRCWGPSSQQQTGLPHAGPPSAQAWPGTAHGCCLKQRRLREWTVLLYLLEQTWLFLTFQLHQLLMELPTQGHFLPVFLQKVLVGFRHLTDCCWDLPKRKHNVESQKSDVSFHQIQEFRSELPAFWLHW